ncbi:MAG: TetR/AcrR family transcriptional regulator [Candidatus Abyssubacteria bacterium]|nr:TetR/AcrR family transcriptional regulator [Candidatus Abyssubacteria bacterium]
MLFRKDGPSGLSIRRIARAIGYSPMALYRYFPQGIDEILAEARIHGYKLLHAKISEATTSVKDSPGKLRAYGKAFVRFFEEHPTEFRLIYEYTSGDWESFPELSRCIDDVWQPFESAIKEAIAEGILFGNAEEVSYLAWAALHGVINLFLTGELTSQKHFNELTESMIEMIIRGAGIAPNE